GGPRTRARTNPRTRQQKDDRKNKKAMKNAQHSSPLSSERANITSVIGGLLLYSKLFAYSQKSTPTISSSLITVCHNLPVFPDSPASRRLPSASRARSRRSRR